MEHTDEYSEARISEAHVKEYDVAKGTLKEEEGQRFGCIGTLSHEPETSTIVKKCEGIEKASVTRTTKLTVTISAHVSVEILKKIYGLSNEGLAEGVYGLNSKSTAIPMLFTAAVTDVFTNKRKLIVYPRLVLTSGFAKEIDNSAEEIAESELTFDAYMDDNEQFYYEAMEDEVSADIKQKWLTQFTPDLVKAEAV